MHLHAVLGWLRRKAKEQLGLSSLRQAHPGAVTVIQRSGSAIDLNVHFHTVALDGVFVDASEDSTPRFHALPAPTDGDIASVAWDACKRTLSVLRKRGLWIDELSGEDTLSLEEPGLASLARASIQGMLVMGPKAGKRLMRFRGASPRRSLGEGGLPLALQLPLPLFKHPAMASICMQNAACVQMTARPWSDCAGISCARRWRMTSLR